MKKILCEYRNPVLISDTSINCEIDHPTHGWIPFTCDMNDEESDIDTQKLFAIMSSDENIKTLSPEEKFEKAASKIRRTRDNILIYEVDSIASNPLRWGDLSSEEQKAISDYRRKLLDITQQEGFPFDVIWPEKVFNL